ncbi:lysophosphatidic acid phosphatase type 6-like isoform X1 [Hydra vulgaris]|uniref:Lysophosphatidic acid phosphatase type 6-like isoform X1 n=2 Tax=Hydra vulgaris TaxID=6087 RepID=A0ABM4BJQ8_HYDVU
MHRIALSVIPAVACSLIIERHPVTDEASRLQCLYDVVNIAKASLCKPIRAAEHQMQLLQVQAVFRHGARTPTTDSNYKDIPNAEPFFWDKSQLMTTLPHVDIEYKVQLPDGKCRPNSLFEEFYRKSGTLEGGCFSGQLTKVGQQDAYLLGKWLEDEYINKHKLFRMYSTKDVYVRSSNIDRTILSAKCVLAGLFSKDGFKEVPVIITSEHDDEILYPNYSVCDSLKKWYTYIRSNVASVLDHSKDYEHISSILGRMNKTMSFLALYDFIVTRKAHGGFVPVDLMQEEFLISKRAAEFQAYIITGDDRLLGLRRSIGAFINVLCSNITDSNKTEKMYLYSAHDTTIIALLMVLDLWEEKWPAFSSSIIFELYTNQVGNKFVRVLYNGTAMSLKIDGHTEYYPLNKFLTLLENFRVEDWRKECGEQTH